ncbi:hypothetical protein C8R46DRAFT_1063686 [Mycena filopes]|nr:hypothetical protein C8R46DRAFT_1063686 [Mycena filopes]
MSAQNTGDAEAAMEHSLLVHIRHLLLNYAIAHITTDYIQLTDQAVVDLWNQYFVEIPTADPHALILPTDPFETLARLHGLRTCEPFQEKFQSTPGGNSKSERVAFEESHFESHVPICLPFSPVLTARARRETPAPPSGPTKFRASLHSSHPQFLSSQGIKSVVVEPMSEPSAKQDDVLCTSWRLRPEEHDAVRSLLRPVLGRCPKEYRNQHLLAPSSRPDTPPKASRVQERPFIPIFPRRRRAGGGVREGDLPPAGLKGIASLPAVILPEVKIEELEPELHKRNMVVVDGWQTIRSSPSPTPSPGSSQECDELLSPDTTPPPARPTKMDVVQIPRIRRIGGTRKKPPPIGHGTNLGTFLVPLVQKAAAPDNLARLSPEPTASMLGQADSTCDAAMDIDEGGFDVAVGGLYRHHKQDPRDLILKEKLDEKRQLLMEVPTLPPPNEHPPNALFLPLFLGDLVAPLKTKGQIDPQNLAHYKFLKKAKGIPSLNVELSWVPIAAKTRIPTNSEIIKATSLLDTDSDLPTQLVALLRSVPASLSQTELPLHSDSWSRRYGNIYPEGEELDPELAHCEIILSRKERRRMAGLPDEVQEDVEDSDEAMDTEEPPMGEHRSAKRRRLSRDEYLDDSGIAFDTPEYKDGPAFYDDPGLYYPPDGNKENLPPFDPDCDAPVHFDADYHEQPDPDNPATTVPVDSHASQDDSYMGYEPREFVALSFEESVPLLSAQPTQTRPPPPDQTSDDTYAGMFEPHPNAIINDSALPSFAKLRAKKITAVSQPDLTPASTENDANTIPTHLEEPSRTIPDHVYDKNTLRLPTTWITPNTLHRYMVSMDLVQKQGLLRSLRSRSCSIDLVERDSLGGVDIILDPHTAIIYANLLVLPSACADLTLRIAQQSWLYARLLVIFDAYPASHSYQAKANSDAASELFAYSPPVLKALGKLRRDVGIAEGCGNKRRACVVQYAFADTVNEAALFTRYFGDFAEANDESGGAIWGDRIWLDDDVPEGEQDLAAADGMNRFAAFLILCQIDLGEFLELSAEARVEQFGGFVGFERMDLLNQVIERRLRAMEASDETSVVTGATGQS